MNAIKSSALALILFLSLAEQSQAAPFKWPMGGNKAASPSSPAAAGVRSLPTTNIASPPQWQPENNFKMPTVNTYPKPQQSQPNTAVTSSTSSTAGTANNNSSGKAPAVVHGHRITHSVYAGHQAARTASVHQVAALPAVRVAKRANGECIAISTDKLFDPDQATIMPSGEELLSKQIARLGDWSEHPVTIEVHTDNFGFESYIRSLSQQRADKLKAWFVQRGLFKDIQVVAVGAGKAAPLFANQHANGKDDLNAMANNRRVEISVDKSKGIVEPVAQAEPTPLDGMIHPQQTEWGPGSGGAVSSNAGNDQPTTAEPDQPLEPAANPDGMPVASESTTGNPILDTLPRLEDVKRHSGDTHDMTSEPEPPRQAAPTEEQIRQRQWEQKEFGLWRDDD
jgi:outer membrane protein OmpA-like peptidoglycan-associated protein